MNKTIFGLGMAFLMTACGFTGEADGVSTTPTEIPASSAALTRAAATPLPLPEVQCQGELPEALAEVTAGYRLADESDFVSSIRDFNQNATEDLTCSIFTADFDEDKDRDYALLLVDDKTSSFRVQLALNQGNGTFKPLVLKEFEPLADTEAGSVYISLNFKRPGSEGLANREYSPLTDTARNVYLSKPAIDHWRAIQMDEQGKPTSLDVSSLGYCSDAYYYVNGNLVMFTVCD